MSTQDWSRTHKGNRVQANSIPIEPIVSFFGGETRGGTGEIRVKCLMHNDSHRSASMNVDTLLIEEMKYRKLITQAAERDLIPFYINSTPKGVFSFDLMDVPEPEWVSHWMPATTEFSRVQKISKLVGYLAIEEAVQL